MAQIMIDIETVGRRNDAAIREVGLVAFEYDGRILASLQLSVIPSAWNTCNRTFSGETVLWLRSSGQIDMNYNCKSYEQLLNSIDSFFNKYRDENTRVWSKGHMDIQVLKDLYEEFYRPEPWIFGQPRDMNTIFDFFDARVPQKRLPAHKAVEDALLQVGELCNIIKTEHKI